MTSLAFRSNNPGNVSLPIAGYTPPPGTYTITAPDGQPNYAVFPTAQDGYNAFVQRVISRINGGYDTIASLNSIYAESPNWKFGVSSISGIGVNDKLDPNNAQQMSDLRRGILTQESPAGANFYNTYDSGVGTSGGSESASTGAATNPDIFLTRIGSAADPCRRRSHKSAPVRDDPRTATGGRIA